VRLSRGGFSRTVHGALLRQALGAARAAALAPDGPEPGAGDPMYSMNLRLLIRHAARHIKSDQHQDRGAAQPPPLLP
jgi:hypothetical protein